MSGLLKRCAGCGEWKSLAEFNAKKSAPGLFYSYCKSCNAARVKNYYERHPEKRRAVRRRHYAAHKDTAQYKEAAARWRVANPELIKEYGGRTRAKPEHKAYKKAWADANRERMRGYRRAWRMRNGLAVLSYEEIALREVRRANRKAAAALMARPPMDYPYLTDTTVGDGAELLTIINALVPRLAESVRADVCQELALSVLIGEVKLEELSLHVRDYAKRQFMLSNKRLLYLDSLSARARENVEIYAQQLSQAWGAS
jgi:hypothetical protein